MRKFIILLPILLLVGCSHALSTAKLARTQNILVTTPFAEDAKCTLTDSRGRSWKVKKTPNNVAVQDGHSPMQVICRKKGFKTTIETVSEHKEELLTIDGERVTMSIYDQFPTKMPRLIPTAIKEATSFALDPLGQISTKYPDEIVVWMEPEVWNSEQEMRQWAYEKFIWENRVEIALELAEIKDEKRKEVRRDKKHARQEKRQEYLETAKKILEPETYADAIRGTTQWTMDGAQELVGASVDSGGIVLKGSKDTTHDVLNKTTDMAKEVDPRPALKWLHQKGQELNSSLMPDMERFKPSTASKLEKSRWFPNWLKHSVVGKVGNWGKEKLNRGTEEFIEEEKEPAAKSRIEQIIMDVEAKKPLSDTPPWVLE